MEPKEEKRLFFILLVFTLPVYCHGEGFVANLGLY